jgi:hypothetical protein
MDDKELSACPAHGSASDWIAMSAAVAADYGTSKMLTASNGTATGKQ